MKTPAKKATKAASKANAKLSAPAKKVSAKAPVKAVAKAAAKAKPAVKAKPAAKAAAKPVAKAKPAAKAPAKKAVPAKKPAAVKKPVAAKPVPVKAKAPAKKASPPTSKAAKTAKPAPKAVAKPLAKPAAKAPAAKVPVAKSSAVAAAPATPAKAPAPATPTPASDLPIRSTRPSARLAQITVPSMPQAVASTAAKASFLPQMPTTVQPVPIASIKKDPKLANNWKNKAVEQLSDAEVLAMPDAEYMNDVQMAFFRLKLVQLKQDILANAGETTEHLREDTVVVPDPADRATIEEEHALELRTRDRERKLLKKIEQSIARIDAGDYGYCDETGEPIGVGRLLARPTATLSLEAQQRRELKQKMFGD